MPYIRVQVNGSGSHFFFFVILGSGFGFPVPVPNILRDPVMEPVLFAYVTRVKRPANLSVSVDDSFAQVQVRAGLAVVAQLLLRLDSAQQPVHDVVVQPGGGGVGGRQFGRHRAVGPQVPRAPRPAMPDADAGALGDRAAQQHVQQQPRGARHNRVTPRRCDAVCGYDHCRRIGPGRHRSPWSNCEIRI